MTEDRVDEAGGDGPGLSGSCGRSPISVSASCPCHALCPSPLVALSAQLDNQCFPDVVASHVTSAARCSWGRGQDPVGDLRESTLLSTWVLDKQAEHMSHLKGTEHNRAVPLQAAHLVSLPAPWVF